MLAGTRDVRASDEALGCGREASRAIRSAALGAIAALVCAQPGDNFHDAAFKAAGDWLPLSHARYCTVSCVLHY
jgi:hypothetical protein